jgi:hypothetical protein
LEWAILEPQLGWVWLSQKERRTAELALAEFGPDGTRDELGFGVIHFGYADRFFPGTSVQHTKLRYIWFVCWSYLELQQRFGGEAFQKTELDRIEDRTGQKLLRHYGNDDGNGIIGGRVLRVGRSPVVKPSAVYWNAMRTWGLVRPLSVGRDAPGRGELHSRWPDLTGKHGRPEVDPDQAKSIFFDPPPVPSRWRSQSEPLTFDLDNKHDEAGRILRAWAVPRDALGRRSLLYRLAERGGATPTSIISSSVLALCDEDEKVSLRRAACAGSLAAISRAIHTALVQKMKDSSADANTTMRRWLDDAVQQHAEQAAKLDRLGLLVDVPEASKLIPLIEATQAWLSAGAGEISVLEDVYRSREEAQKPGRALLARSGGDRRAHWWPREPVPLSYRWDRVTGFLDQLRTR